METKKVFISYQAEHLVFAAASSGCWGHSMGMVLSTEAERRGPGGQGWRPGLRQRLELGSGLGA